MILKQVIELRRMSRSDLFLLTLILTLTACQAVVGSQTSATLQAERDSLLAEAAALDASATADAQRVQATAAAAQTTAAEINSINQQLLATARAAIPPTLPRVVGSAPEVTEFGTLSPFILEFLNTGTASRVRNSDGCAESLQNQFPANIDRIYITTRAINIAAGTVMGVEWRYEGQLVLQETWTVPRDAADFCLWFYIEPSDVPFRPGRWSVRLTANGAPIEPEVSFLMTAVQG